MNTIRVDKPHVVLYVIVLIFLGAIARDLVGVLLLLLVGFIVWLMIRYANHQIRLVQKDIQLEDGDELLWVYTRSSLGTFEPSAAKVRHANGEISYFPVERGSKSGPKFRINYSKPLDHDGLIKRTR